MGTKQFSSMKQNKSALIIIIFVCYFWRIFVIKRKVTRLSGLIAFCMYIWAFVIRRIPHRERDTLKQAENTERNKKNIINVEETVVHNDW